MRTLLPRSLSINRYLPEFGLSKINDFMAWRYPVDSAETAIIVDSVWIGRIGSLGNTPWIIRHGIAWSVSEGCLRRFMSALTSGYHHIDFPEELGLPTQWVES